MKLESIYQYYLDEFKKSGKKPYPDRLLALIILPEKDKYEGLMVEEGKFYNFYKKEIDAKIKRVMTDFTISKDEMVDYIEASGILYREEDYEHDKIWHVFAEGFGCMHWALMYYPDLTPEEIYKECLGCFFDEDNSIDLDILNRTSKILKRKK